jgi:hypothetical protein
MVERVGHSERREDALAEIVLERWPETFSTTRPSQSVLVL